VLARAGLTREEVVLLLDGLAGLCVPVGFDFQWRPVASDPNDDLVVTCAALKLVKPERETAALRAWRAALPPGTELVTSELARLEIARTLLRARVDPQRVPFFTEQALQSLYLLDVTRVVLARAVAFQAERLGSLDAIHLASAEPFRTELTDFVTYDLELSAAASDLGMPVRAPA